MAEARLLAETESLDAAVIDLRIRGEKAYAICEILESRHLPFVLTTGYAASGLPTKWADCPLVEKPYKLEDIQVALTSLFV
jgi:ActR/RegA family two-component response regulator